MNRKQRNIVDGVLNRKTPSSVDTIAAQRLRDDGFDYIKDAISRSSRPRHKINGLVLLLRMAGQRSDRTGTHRMPEVFDVAESLLGDADAAVRMRAAVVLVGVLGLLESLGAPDPIEAVGGKARVRAALQLSLQASPTPTQREMVDAVLAGIDAKTPS